MTKFSVIIAVRDITDFLKESISNLQKLDYKDFEVLIITDNPVTFDFNGDTRFFIYDSSGSGNPSLKRNLGAQKAAGDILVFLDDDAYPSTNWLTVAAKIFEDPNVYALGGPAMTPPSAGFLEKVSGYILKSWLASGGTTFRHTPEHERDIDDFPTVNLFVRKNAFDKVGGFILDFWPGEDTKLCLDLIKEYSRKFKYSPKPIVYHHRRNVLKSHLKQISRYGNHRGQFARVFPENSRSLSYFIPSMFLVWLIFGGLGLLFIPMLRPFYFVVLAIYASLLFVEAVKVSSVDKNMLTGVYFIAGIFLTHLVYGYNFLIGFIRKPELKLKTVDKATGNYIGG